jgi:hypothetical protein
MKAQEMRVAPQVPHTTKLVSHTAINVSSNNRIPSVLILLHVS